jgi:hypothetical protein
MTWGPRGELVLVKSNVEDGIELIVTRLLKSNGRILVMVSGCSATLISALTALDLPCRVSAQKQVARNLKDGKQIVAEQTFEKAA